MSGAGEKKIEILDAFLGEIMRHGLDQGEMLPEGDGNTG
ncbi:MAG: hypothetical protein HLUCCO17_13910 [Saliniramus fredricksonii]|jgi:hypothetical protein|uniref:Uncharacterized protein n=1 Tax=Saliniramus fredricksonii TaxID=1653334 RepID=A0A0P7Y5X7_9HYPH|nr:MAG: hypothetical protein HLUCCO17_13910 [Saliniramus fredricksonii]